MPGTLNPRGVSALKKIIRIGLPMAVALGSVLPFASVFAQQDQPKAERTKKKTDKSKRKGKGGGDPKKAGEYKGQ